MPTKPDLPVGLKAQKVLHSSSIFFFILRAQKVQIENPICVDFQSCHGDTAWVKEGHLRDTEDSGFGVNTPR